MQELRIFQIKGEINQQVWVVVVYMLLLFLQCLATLFSKRFSHEKKTWRSLILAVVFALPWFLIYNQTA
jgi:hypothetical protein